MTYEKNSDAFSAASSSSGDGVVLAWAVFYQGDVVLTESSCVADAWRKARLEVLPLTVQQEQFQQQVQPWMMECFGAEISADKAERNHRFLEEALELVQACGCSASEAHQLVDYVYGRPVGEPAQEVGGTMVTLAALCLAQGLDMHQAADVELARVWTKVEAIRAKQASKPKHSPLPQDAGSLTATSSAMDAVAVGWNAAMDCHAHHGIAGWTVYRDQLLREAASKAGDKASNLHPDDVAVDALAHAMKAKLARQRARGYGGWNTDCTQQRLTELLRAHVEKGDPVDVANFCAFLAARGEGISPLLQDHDGARDAPTQAQIEAAAKVLAESMDYPWDGMTDKGKDAMRESARKTIDAARAAQGGVA